MIFDISPLCDIQCISFYTVHSFIDLVKYVFSVPGVKEEKITLLSRNLCQDPLENFFGCQGQRGGTSENPNAAEFKTNTQALRVVDSFCCGPVRGNCRSSESRAKISSTDIEPLPKRRARKRTHSKM